MAVRDVRGDVQDRRTTALPTVDTVDPVLAELARAVDRDLSTPDLAPATVRAYAHDWADFASFCAGHELAALPAAPQTLALYLKSPRRPAAGHRALFGDSRRPSVSTLDRLASRCRRSDGGLRRSQSATLRRATRRPPTIHWFVGCYAGTRARAGRRQRKGAADNRATARDPRGYAG